MLGHVKRPGYRRQIDGKRPQTVGKYLQGPRYTEQIKEEQEQSLEEDHRGQ
jgi:hypothetical protein